MEIVLERAKAGAPGAKAMLRAGDTCWRIAEADRVAFLIDSASYFMAAKAALCNAQRSVILLGWNFDARTPLDPRQRLGDSMPDEIGEFMSALSRERPDLDIRILIWDMALALSARSGWFPRRAGAWFRGERVRFRLDSSVPRGACQHRKLLVVDDAVAFCGGGDFAPERWDTARHVDRDPRRKLPSGERYPPRHEVMIMVGGDAAASLGELARGQWRRATGEDAAPLGQSATKDVWPGYIDPAMTNVPAGIVRTEPEREGAAGIRENEALCLNAIAAARDTIYLENQYFCSPVIAGALAERLQEPDGPEVVVVCSTCSPGFLDGVAMDSARDRLIPKLRRADRYGRFQIYGPRTEAGRVIIVHSKVMVVDDRLARAGSSNINNRSFGFDVECDVAVEAGDDDEDSRAAIARFRNRLLAHFLGTDADQVAASIDEHRSVIAAIASLDSAECPRLPALEPAELGRFKSLIAKYHLGDPRSPRDAFRPWRRAWLPDRLRAGG